VPELAEGGRVSTLFGACIRESEDA
jgi:hypothetical protein